MIQRQTVSHPRAPVVAKDMGGGQAEVIHQRDDIGGHLAFGIGQVARVIRRGVTVAIAAQIGDQHAEMAGKVSGHACPAHAVLRIAMQQDQRRARPRLLQ